MSSKKWEGRGIEPPIEDVMSDPIVALIMARDNIDKDDVWKVVEKAKAVIENKAA